MTLPRLFIMFFSANQRRVHSLCVAKLPNKAECIELQHVPFFCQKLIPREIYVNYLTIFSGYTITHIARMLTHLSFVRKFVP